MIKLIISALGSIFSDPSDSQAYQKGWDFGFSEYHKHANLDWPSRKLELEHLASGGFNTKSHHVAFDNGLLAALEALP